MGQQAEQKDLAGKKDRKSIRTRKKSKRGDSKVESNDSPEIPDREETSDNPVLPSRVSLMTKYEYLALVNRYSKISPHNAPKLKILTRFRSR